MSRRSRALATMLLAFFPIIFICTELVSAQSFNAVFGAEAQIQPMPFMLNATIFDLMLGASVPDAEFSSHSQFDLSGFRSQQFTIGLMLGALNVEDRLLFQPVLDFQRNSLALSVQMLGFNLALETILEDLGPPSPDINPGIVIEAGGRSSLGLGITSFTGFGVTRIVEDHTTVFACVSIELRCLGIGYPDDEYDRLVTKPFLFSEQAVRLDWVLKPVRLSVTPLFTLSGLERVLVGASVNLATPFLSFVSQSTFDTTGPITFSRQQIIIEMQYGILGWRAITLFAGPPFSFDTQTFKLRLSFSGFNFYTTAIFDLSGFDEFRFGAGFAF